MGLKEGDRVAWGLGAGPGSLGWAWSRISNIWAPPCSLVTVRALIQNPVRSGQGPWVLCVFEFCSVVFLWLSTALPSRPLF